MNAILALSSSPFHLETLLNPAAAQERYFGRCPSGLTTLFEMRVHLIVRADIPHNVVERVLS